MSSNYRNTVERMTLLQLQTELDQECCSVCPFSYESNNDKCEGCDAYKELRRIGDWLNKDSQQHKPSILHESRSGRIKATRDDYIELKARGLTDAEIAYNMGVGVPTLGKWKVRNNVHSTSHLEGVMV